MFLTADTVNKIYNLCLKDKRYEEVLQKHLSNKQERDEFRQHLWLQICENDHDKVIRAWNERWFIYFYVSICTRQVASNSSTWHYLYRKDVKLDYVDNYQENSDELVPDEHMDVAFRKEIVENALTHFENIDKDFRKTARIFRQKFYEKKTCRSIEEFNDDGKRMNKDKINEEIKKAKHHIQWYIKKRNLYN